jgi:large subunit ribosomal protein L9
VKVILIKDMGKLGKEGDVAEVKDGYGRNYLIPQGFALAATDRNFNKLKELQKIKDKLREQEKTEAQAEKDKIEKVSLTVAVEAKENEELYGTVPNTQILKLLSAEGITIDKDALIIDEPIKKLGVYTVKVRLHPDVEAAFRVWVVKNK